MTDRVVARGRVVVLKPTGVKLGVIYSDSLRAFFVKKLNEEIARDGYLNIDRIGDENIENEED